MNNEYTGLEVAVIGMAGNFPQAGDLGAFWQNLRQGKESMLFCSDEELAKEGITDEVIRHPDFVKSKGSILEQKEYFDPAFFEYLPSEAEAMNPHTRLLHECAWKALEDAGYNADNVNEPIGLFLGAPSGQWDVISKFAAHEQLGSFAADYLSNIGFTHTLISYKLNLRGPSYYVNTACSTSLVSVHQACQALLVNDCKIAVAGGLSFSVMPTAGYFYQDGMINSKDGHCRTFDAEASGTTRGEGGGLVVLKLLEDAIKDNDHIYAVIKGSAVNNDGKQKIGFTAPGVKGQSQVIRKALKLAEVPAESISYIETHGTATALGDVTEVEALKMAFNSDKKQFCGIGSVKTNIGHLGEAAGIAGFIKTVLALKHKQIPPSLHFKVPNPKIDFENSPFYVNAQLQEWKSSNGAPLRAGVSSFGIGGTNAHVVLEQAPELNPSGVEESQLILLSAKTPAALDQMTLNLAQFLKENPSVNLNDVAYTLQVGRKEFACRRKILCDSVQQASEILSDLSSRKIQSFKVKGEQHPVVFMFSGLGSQYAGMCRDLYDKEPVFKQHMDECFEKVSLIAKVDLKAIVFSSDLDPALMHRIDTAQYSVFVTGYCLAKLLMSWGIEPHAMIGYSFGEYIAACLAGVFSLEDALRIIHYRGELVKQLPAGCMMSLPLNRLQSLELIEKYALSAELNLAIDNGESCVVSGTPKAMAMLEEKCKDLRLMTMRLESTRAVHSFMMEPALAELQSFISKFKLNAPAIPYVSNVTGNWIIPADATSPAYWAKQLRNTAEFFKGIETLQQNDKLLYIEIGPGSDIATLVNRQLEIRQSAHKAIGVVRPQQNNISDHKYLINKIGQLWLYGAGINWKNFHQQKPHRLSLPTYPFERQRFWKLIDDYRNGKYAVGAAKSRRVSDWLYVPTWKRAEPASKTLAYDLPQTLLIFMDQHTLGQSIADKLTKNSDTKIITVSIAGHYTDNGNHYQIDPSQPGHYEQLFAELEKEQSLPDQIIHLFSLSEGQAAALNIDTAKQALDLGYYSLVYTAQALASLNIGKKIRIDVIANGIAEVTGAEATNPVKAALLGPVKVIPQEFADLPCRCIDLDASQTAWPVQQLLNMLFSDKTDSLSALRGNYTWVPDFENRPFKTETSTRLKDKGVYLITGGLGGTALALGNFLAERVKAKLVLIGRTALPPKNEWNEWLDKYGPTDSTSEKIIQLKQIEQNGGEALIISADIASKDRLQEALQLATDKFGAINGVIHTATLPDGGMIAVREKKLSEDIFQSKIYGSLLLDELLKDQPLDFTVYFSSLNAITGGLGQVGYCAANIFLDAFAQYKCRRDNSFTVSINWDRWKNTGIARIGEKMHRELTNEELSGGMQIEEAVACFMQILNTESGSQVAVSETDLKTAIEQSYLARQIEEEQVSESALKSSSSIKLTRPDLSADYAAAQNELEEKLVHMWEQFFGIDKLGVHDNFFELGGDSLKGMVLLKRMKKELNYDAGIKLFFVKPSIRQIADEIAEIKQLIEKKERSSKITI